MYYLDHQVIDSPVNKIVDRSSFIIHMDSIFDLIFRFTPQCHCTAPPSPSPHPAMNVAHSMQVNSDSIPASSSSSSEPSTSSSSDNSIKSAQGRRKQAKPQKKPGKQRSECL